DFEVFTWGSGPARWTVYAKDGRIFEYVPVDDQAQSPPNSNTGIANVWVLIRVTDRTGANEMRIAYVDRSASVPSGLARQYYPIHITYGPAESSFDIRFTYTFDLPRQFDISGQRPHPLSAYRSGTQIQYNDLLRYITIREPSKAGQAGKVTRSYELIYDL